MVIATAIVTMLIVFAIAAGAVGREAHLLDAVPARPVFDPDEATTWIAEHLPPQTTAAMSYAEVGLVVNATLDLLRSNAGVAATSGPRQRPAAMHFRHHRVITSLTKKRKYRLPAKVGLELISRHAVCSSFIDVFQQTEVGS